jgi:hypothetical protein
MTQTGLVTAFELHKDSKRRGSNPVALLTRAGRFMNGRALLFSAFNATLRLEADFAGVKAETDPARTAVARAVNFTIFDVVEFESRMS